MVLVALQPLLLLNFVNWFNLFLLRHSDYCELEPACEALMTIVVRSCLRVLDQEYAVK
jgi:hypothetical protein